MRLSALCRTESKQPKRAVTPIHRVEICLWLPGEGKGFGGGGSWLSLLSLVGRYELLPGPAHAPNMFPSQTGPRQSCVLLAVLPASLPQWPFRKAFAWADQKGSAVHHRS